jgi:RNA polymerase sigma-70 factor (ECF subfamily)
MSASSMSQLVGLRPRFFEFVRRQVVDDATAEDIVQLAFARAAHATEELRSPSRATAWFYRILRNAIVDHHRRNSAREHVLAQLAREHDVVVAPQHKLVCACVFKVLPTLRPEYEGVLRAVEIEGRTVEEAARHLRITANNASVRLHRARASLRGKLMEFCINCCPDESVGACVDCYCHD